MNFKGSKKIETDRLILRPTEESDLKILWQILLDSNVNKYYLTSWINSDWEKEKIFQMKKLEHANDSDVFQWSVVKKDKNLCVGQISVQERGKNISIDIRDIGWFIDPREQRKGYAYEAALAILNYMFDEVGITKIDTSSAIENVASWKLMEKLGFKRKDETKMVKYTFIDELVENYSYELTKDNFNNIK